MEERITLRICANYWIRPDRPGYDFKLYDSELKTSRTKNWGEGSLNERKGEFFSATPRGRLEDIAYEILLSERFNRMKHPSYEISLWEGRCPMKIHQRDKTGLLTKIPNKNVIPRLGLLFDQYYELKELIASSHYERAYNKLINSRVGRHAFLNAVDDASLTKFYIDFRRVNKATATKMIKRFLPQNYFELETAFLHDLESRKTD